MENYDDITQLHFQHVLRRFRLEAGLTQEQLSEKIGVSPGFYSMMEIGRKWPNINMLFRIAEALGKRPGELVDALEKESKK
ncbi:helix-turn-helix domain-containing protein [Nitratidesulfovibrio vulgaris]|uniref:helix-turn-helix domain-containing protein n=1 Tax=Nitratidesulfovibrio vulgaris TaxID=881 RepID=UPI0023005446|nr:helix-turn-helix transcriptional regulator [Nitratidesulfovibrio vulgaris]WCB45731.1 helix-turn-helix transcriptional regulator [Nitratidesulfovibrio vulgaris]